MIKLSKNLEYALMALNELCGQGLTPQYSVKALAEQLNAPFDPLSRVMQKLNRAQIISSIQGVGGGYKLSVDLSKVSLHDLILSLQGPLELVKCMSAEFECSMHSNCEIKSPVNYLNDKIVNFYKSISLAELLNSNTANSFNSKEALA